MKARNLSLAKRLAAALTLLCAACGAPAPEAQEASTTAISWKAPWSDGKPDYDALFWLTTETKMARTENTPLCWYRLSTWIGGKKNKDQYGRYLYAKELKDPAAFVEKVLPLADLATKHPNTEKTIRDAIPSAARWANATPLDGSCRGYGCALMGIIKLVRRPFVGEGKIGAEMRAQLAQELSVPEEGTVGRNYVETLALYNAKQIKSLSCPSASEILRAGNGVSDNAKQVESVRLMLNTWVNEVHK